MSTRSPFVQGELLLPALPRQAVAPCYAVAAPLAGRRFLECARYISPDPRSRVPRSYDPGGPVRPLTDPFRRD